MGRSIGFFLRWSSSELYPHLVECGGYLRKGCQWTRPYPVSVFHPVCIHLEVRVYVLTCTTPFLSSVVCCEWSSGDIVCVVYITSSEVNVLSQCT